ncbi:MAG: phage tail protein [Spirulina sp.]
MRGFFGPLEFENAYSPTGATLKLANKLAEHPRLETKGVLQWTGYDLNLVDLKFRWDYWHTNPAAQVETAMAMLMAHDAYPLVTVTEVKGTVYGMPYGGSDIFENEYVMAKFDIDVKHTDHSGRLTCVEATAHLIEVVQDGGIGGIGAGGGGFLGAIGGFISGLFG